MQTLGQLAETIRAELIGDAQAVIQRARSFDLAEAGDVTLASSGRYRPRINESPATAFIVSEPLEGSDRNQLVARSPKLTFARAIEALHREAYVAAGVADDLVIGKGSVLGKDLSIHPRVTIGRDSIIGNRATLHPGVVIGDRCIVGDDTVIFPNVSIYSDSQIGSRVVIHAGAVIGADGFGFVPDEEGRQVKLLQLGCVRILDDCEIGAGCAIDRGGFGDTVLHRGVKLDNLVQVGHGTEIGEDTVVAALAGFSGGTKIGRGCVIAGQAGTNHHVTIGDRAVILGGGAATKNVKAGAVIAGYGQPRDLWLRGQVLGLRLPEFLRRLRRLEMIVKGSEAQEAK